MTHSKPAAFLSPALFLLIAAHTGCTDGGKDHTPDNNVHGDASAVDGQWVDAAKDNDGAVSDGSSAPQGPELLYTGPMTGSAIPGWSSSAPRPLIVEARQSQSTVEARQSIDWAVSMAHILPGGTITDIIADEVQVWGWPMSSSCAPGILFSGAMSSAAVSGWSHLAPRPVVVEALLSATSDWFVSMARIRQDGAVSEIMADQAGI